jgi:gluconate kinase
MKTVYILFGEMGCGKTYSGYVYAKRHGFEFFEGDSVVTARMANRVAGFKPLTRDMIEEYMDILSDAIADRMEHCDHLVVSQALYFDEDRVLLKSFLESFGYHVEMWWIKSKWYRNIQNLLSRENGWKWVVYWLFNKPFFQKPTHAHDLWRNVDYR